MMDAQTLVRAKLQKNSTLDFLLNCFARFHSVTFDTGAIGVFQSNHPYDARVAVATNEQTMNDTATVRTFLATMVAGMVTFQDDPSSLPPTPDNTELAELCGCKLCSEGDYPLGRPAEVIEIDSRILDIAAESNILSNINSELLEDGLFLTCADVQYFGSWALSSLTFPDETVNSLLGLAFEWGFQMDPTIRRKCGCPKLTAKKCTLPAPLCIIPQILFPLLPILQHLFILPVALGIASLLF